jgi:hypothetical protein
MPNTAGWCNSFKTELAKGIHAFGQAVVRASDAKDSFKGALYQATGNISIATTAYTAAGEASGTGYTAGGIAVPNDTEPTNTANVSYWTPSAPLVYADVTISNINALLLYNETQGNRSCGVFTFPAQNVVAGTLTLAMPANAPATAVLQIA